MPDPASIAWFLNGLQRLDSGGLARLRRSAGQSLNESHNSYTVFYPILPRSVERQDEQAIFFLVATLYALCTRAGEHERQRGGTSLGTALHQLRQGQLSDQGRANDDRISLDRRVLALFNADSDQLPFRLRQIVRLLHSNELSLNWERLLLDLLRWDHPERYIQQRWAREYFTGYQQNV